MPKLLCGEKQRSVAGYRRHIRGKEKACPPCAEANRDYQAVYAHKRIDSSIKTSVTNTEVELRNRILPARAKLTEKVRSQTLAWCQDNGIPVSTDGACEEMVATQVGRDRHRRTKTPACIPCKKAMTLYRKLKAEGAASTTPRPGQVRRGRPRQIDLTYYIYVVGFCTGMTKVGQTNTLRKRMSRHRVNASNWGKKMERQFAIEVPDALAAQVIERALIRWAEPEASEIIAREHFHGLQFERTVEAAKSLVADFTAGHLTGRPAPRPKHTRKDRLRSRINATPEADIGVYVALFDEGTVKVGHASDLDARLGAHRDKSGIFDIAMTEHFLLRLPTKSAAIEIERELLRLCTERASKVRGKEHFRGLDFNDVVAALIEIAGGQNAGVVSVDDFDLSA